MKSVIAMFVMAVFLSSGKPIWIDDAKAYLKIDDKQYGILDKILGNVDNGKDKIKRVMIGWQHYNNFLLIRREVNQINANVKFMVRLEIGNVSEGGYESLWIVSTDIGNYLYYVGPSSEKVQISALTEDSVYKLRDTILKNEVESLKSDIHNTNTKDPTVYFVSYFSGKMTNQFAIVEPILEVKPRYQWQKKIKSRTEKYTNIILALYQIKEKCIVQ